MKSIRLALVLYFLALLGLALAAVGGFAYRTTGQTLRAKEESTGSLLLAQYEDRCHAVHEELDQRVLRRAQTLARLAQSQSGHNPMPQLAVLGVLTAAANPSGQALVPVWVGEAVDGPLGFRLWWWPIVQIRHAEDLFPEDVDEHAAEYFQVYNEWGQVLQRSRSMGRHSFTLDPEVRAETELYDHHFDDVELPGGARVRRVTLKVPVVRFRYRPPWVRSSPRPELPAGSPRPRREPSAGSGRRGLPLERISPAVFIQCAGDTRRRDAALAELDAELDADLVRLEAESHATLAELRDRLLGIGLLTFTAGVVGGLGLVWLGLGPLRRLSEAVSRVSPADFRLDCDADRLPAELRPIAERLAQTLNLLKRAFAREKQAAADISHELRTPLAALLTTTEVALRKPRPAEDYRTALADCQGIGRQMTQLVERLLALARLDAGVDALRPREVDAADLADQCAALVRPLAEARGLSLAVRRNGPAPLTADADKLREVLLNLLHNAIEYSRPKGSVTVTVDRQPDALRLAVEDTGIGIAPEAREHIFERFYRADPSRHADGMHAGLGLSIVKGYVELMGGGIEVASTPGQGTTFTVQLPA